MEVRRDRSQFDRQQQRRVAPSFACRRHVKTRLAATPLRRSTPVTVTPAAKTLLDDPTLPSRANPVARSIAPRTSARTIAMTLKRDFRSHIREMP
jgi:hypothetical protein